MSVSTSTYAPVTTIAPYRTHVVNVATALGWSWSQVTTNTDQFSKDGVTIVATWASRVLSGFAVISQDGTMVNSVTGSTSAKLQKLSTALGGKMSDSQKWASLPEGHPFKLGSLAKLKTQAATSFLVIEPAEAPAEVPAEVPAVAPKASRASRASRASKAKAQAAKDAAHIAEL